MRRVKHDPFRFLQEFWAALRRHRKRGNRNIRPLGVVKSWRMAQCERHIRLGGQERHVPRYMRRNRHD